MRTTGKCPKCGQTEIIPRAMVADRGHGNTERDLRIRIDAHPNALIFKDAERSPLHAYVCVGCGFTELYVEDPQALLQAYRESKREPV
jgi:predicted nucleic-acid-binding Zn-ribbon protein